MDVRTELETVSNIKQGTKEDVYEYTVRLAETIDRELPDAAFESLSDSAKSWMNKAITSYKSNQKLPELPVATTQTDAPVSQTTSVGLGVTTGRMSSDAPNISAMLRHIADTPSKEELGKVVAKALVSDLTKKPAKKVKVKKPISLTPSSSSDIRDVICQNYSLPLSEIEKVLTEKKIPFKSSLVRNVLAYVVSTIKTLNKLGLLKNSTLKGSSESERLRELICTNPTLGVAQIQTLVKESGINCNPATVSVMFYHIKATRTTLKKFDMVD